MHTKVEAFLKEQKEIQKEKEKDLRNKHLRKLGLTDDTKQDRIYRDFHGEGWIWDVEKKKYYKTVQDALEVTDNEYEEICKYVPEPSESSKPVDKKEIKYTEENNLETVAMIVLITGIIASIALFFSIGVYNLGDYSWDVETGLSVSGIVLSVATLISAILINSFLKVITNISVSLKRILDKQ